MSTKKLFHVGIAVKDVDSSAEFFERVFGFRTVQEREITSDYIWRLVGQQGVSARVRMLEIEPDCYLELLTWSGPGQLSSTTQVGELGITQFSAQHICLYTDDAKETYSLLEVEKDVEFVSTEITTVESGPNKGARVFFVKVYGFLFLEVFQKPKV
jgi:catechol 2,3-dioxygenase-like lactoylglutathione lyase family enzyme